MVLLGSQGVPGLRHVPLLPGLGHHSLQFRLVRNSSCSPSRREDFILQKIRRKNTTLLILLRLCPGSTSYAAFLLLLLKAEGCIAFVWARTGYQPFSSYRFPIGDASSDMLRGHR